MKRGMKGLFSAVLLGSMLLVLGCGKDEKPSGFGNQERLWQLATTKGDLEEPLDLPYAKETPALFRDASMGKADPSFVPRVSGG